MENLNVALTVLGVLVIVAILAYAGVKIYGRTRTGAAPAAAAAGTPFWTDARKRAAGYAIFGGTFLGGVILAAIALELEFRVIAWPAAIYVVLVALGIIAYLTWTDNMQSQTFLERFGYRLPATVVAFSLLVAIFVAVDKADVVKPALKSLWTRVFGEVQITTEEAKKAFEKAKSAAPSAPQQQPAQPPAPATGAPGTPTVRYVPPDANVVIDGRPPFVRKMVTVTPRQRLGRPPASVEEATSGMSARIWLARGAAATVRPASPLSAPLFVGKYVPGSPTGGVPPTLPVTPEFLDDWRGYRLYSTDVPGYVVFHLDGTHPITLEVKELATPAEEVEKSLSTVFRWQKPL